ncbi:MAG: hypothetical protein AB7K52_08270 [Phycisphaerales bacterium]
MPADASLIKPLCPRCGYDQSGAIATWDAQGYCPLRGRCTECGLDFEWEDVLRAERLRLPWFFEHAQGGFRSLFSVFQTLVRALHPRAFWGAVRVELRVSPWRAAAWLLLLAGMLHGLTALSRTAELFLIWQSTVVPGIPWHSWINCAIEPFATLRGPLSWDNLHFPIADSPYEITGPLSVLPLTPAILLVLSHSRATSKVRDVHVIRAAVYQVAILLPLWALFVTDSVIESLAAWRVPGVPRSWNFTLVHFVLGRDTPITGGLIALWYGWYWHQVITRGLRLPRGNLVWGLLMVAAALLATITALRDTGFWHLIGID